MWNGSDSVVIHAGFSRTYYNEGPQMRIKDVDCSLSEWVQPTGKYGVSTAISGVSVGFPQIQGRVTREGVQREFTSIGWDSIRQRRVVLDLGGQKAGISRSKYKIS